MFIDLSHFQVRVVLKNTGNDAYLAYPRDIEGTVLGVYIESKRDAKKIAEGNHRSLFDIEDSMVKTKVRWDNDTKSTHNSVRLAIRDFGRLPGLQSIWDQGIHVMDNRPFTSLKPMTKARKTRLQKYNTYKPPKGLTTYSGAYGELPKSKKRPKRTSAKNINNITMDMVDQTFEELSRNQAKKTTYKANYGKVSAASYNDYNTYTINYQGGWTNGSG